MGGTVCAWFIASQLASYERVSSERMLHAASAAAMLCSKTLGNVPGKVAEASGSISLSSREANPFATRSCL
jgi:hypothetical protein